MSGTGSAVQINGDVWAETAAEVSGDIVNAAIRRKLLGLWVTGNRCLFGEMQKDCESGSAAGTSGLLCQVMVGVMLAQRLCWTHL
jgi:hypothetical protein